MTYKPHLQISAKEQFEDAREIAESDPKAAARFEIEGHKALASFYMANNDDSYIKELKTVLKQKLEYISAHEQVLWPESQIDYTIIALAIGDGTQALMFSSLETDFSNSHDFSILLNCKLRKLVGAPEVIDEPEYQPTKVEIGLFAALECAINKKEVDFPLLKSYWKSTKSKRYELTIFEHMDLFAEAIRNAQHSI